MHAVTSRARRFPWWMWPITGPCRLLWWAATRTEKRMGIPLTLASGAALLFAGLFLTSTIIGAIVGIPMTVLGAFLTLRALY